jgi:hypothetical protein
MEPCKGAIAKCGLGKFGLITSDVPEDVTYDDGKVGKAWTGIYLEGNVGAFWCSRHPEVVGLIEDFLPYNKPDYIRGFTIGSGT